MVGGAELGGEYSMTDARARGRGAASAIIDKFKTALKLNWMDMRQVFDRLDEDGSGLLDGTGSRVACRWRADIFDAHTLSALDANGAAYAPINHEMGAGINRSGRATSCFRMHSRSDRMRSIVQE